MYIQPQPEPVPEPVAEAFIAAPEPEKEPEPVMEPAPAVVIPEPVPEPVVIPEPIPEPVIVPEPVAAVSAPEAIKEEAEPEPEKIPVVPVFAQEPEVRPAPINTTREDFTMETGIIISGMSVKGDIISEGSLDVMGNVLGNIEVAGKLEVTGLIEGNSQAEEVFVNGAKIVGEVNSNGSVKIGQNSVVRGNIMAKSAVLAGAVKGDIDVQGPVILDSTAIIMGNIKSKSIQINNGAVIEGLCSQCYADVSPVSFFDEDDKTVKTKKAE
ncbi:MAG TPA: polymer-forming cytoskeletal protein [Lachnospiraceae bacterium]|nr:polymer-forming cytoskeletal protein [Lachnospiraceae bacterium]